MSASLWPRSYIGFTIPSSSSAWAACPTPNRRRGNLFGIIGMAHRRGGHRRGGRSSRRPASLDRRRHGSRRRRSAFSPRAPCR